MNTNLRKIGSYETEINFNSSSDDGWFKELLFSIRIFFKDAWVFIRYNIPCGIRNLFIWLKPIWNNRYWDWCFILDVEYCQLTIMLSRYEKNSFFVGQEYMVGRLKLLIHLIELIKNSDEVNEDRYINVRNWKRFINKKCKFDPDEWHWRCALREEKIWSLYSKVRKNTVRLIWD